MIVEFALFVALAILTVSAIAGLIEWRQNVPWRRHPGMRD